MQGEIPDMIQSLKQAGYRGFALALVSASVLAGCSNPVGDGSHIQPETFAVRHNGEVLVEGSRTQVTGQFSLTLNQVSPVTVHFYRQGQELTVPHGYWLRLEATPAALLSWEPTVQGGFTGTLRGSAAGSGTVRLVLMHGSYGSGHADYTSAVATVVVAP
jgi:hypothetical protein